MLKLNVIKAAVLGLILILSANVSAANGVLKGRIMDNNDSPLPAAAVYVSINNISAIADNEGFYTIPNIGEGEQNIEFSYIGYETQTIKATIVANKTTVLDVKMTPNDVQIEGYEFKGRMSDRAKALSIQKENIQVSNVVSSDQVDRYPDANIGDALKRIPSVNVQYDQGEARFVNIRGTSAEYSAVSINGSKMASAEGETRASQFDLIPSDMIGTIEVNKVVTSDMDADAIGGSVNLVTRGNPTKEDLFLSVGTGYNFISSEPNIKASAIYSNKAFSDKLGYTFSASIFDNKLGSDNHESEWDIDEDDVDGDGNTEELFAKELQVRQYYVERVRQSYSASFDYQINSDHKLSLKGIYNDRKDFENRYRNTTKYKDGEWAMAKEVKAGTEDNKYTRLEHQKVYDLSLDGDHQFGKAELDWKVSMKGASEYRPNERYLTYEGKLDNDDVTTDFSNPREVKIYATDPTVNQQVIDFTSDIYEFDEMTEEEQNTSEQNYSGRFDFKLPLMTGTFANKIKVGAKYASKNKVRDNDFYAYEAIDDATQATFDDEVFSNKSNQTRDGFMAGDYDIGNFVDRDYIGDLDLEDESRFEKEQILEELTVNYDATEAVTATYLRFDQKIGDQIDLVAGVRAEMTTNEYSGFIYDDDAETLTETSKQKDNYTNILPSLLGRYRPVKDMNIKAAYTQTIARPRFYDLVPYQEIARDDNELKLGNPNLKATHSNNLDFMVEYYLKDIGIISGGTFYKGISDIIVTQTYDDKEIDGHVWDKVEQNINGGDATLYGFEFAYQQQLNFLPCFLKQMSVYANYTYNHSEINNFEIEDREDETLAMPGTPAHTFNASLMYDSEKLSAAVSYNMASDFLAEIGGAAFEDAYYDKVGYLDFNLDWKFYQNFTFSASVNNILNQPLRYYQGSEEYTMQVEYYGPTIACGLKYRF